jgi:ketosteroid isomerase-like protein
MRTPTITLLVVLAALSAACVPIFHQRSPVTDAFSRDTRISLPAIAELGQSDREEAESVLLHIARDPDPLRSQAAMNALRSHARLRRAETEEASPDIRVEISALHEAMEEAFRNEDLLGVAAFYADDGLLLGRDGHRVAGRIAIDEYWGRLHGAREWELTLLDVEGEDGIWVERGRSKLSVFRDDELRASEVEFMMVWQRQSDGALLITIDAFW